MKITTSTLDSRDCCEKLIVPMVIRYRKIDERMLYTGFVPGFQTPDVVDENLEACKTKLFDKTRAIIIDMIQKNKPFPFFPTKEELLEDYKDIVNITFANIPNNKK